MAGAATRRLQKVIVFLFLFNSLIFLLCDVNLNIFTLNETK